MIKLKKFLSAGLALIMSFSLLTAVAFAATNSAESDETGPIDVHVGGELWVDEGSVTVLSSAVDTDGPCDIEGSSDVITGRNINHSGKITLGKGDSKTYSFNVNGGLFTPDHNAVSVVITKESGGKYQYISEDVTNDRELANETYSGNASRTLNNLVPGNTYEVTIINLGTDDLVLDVSITSYID